MPVYAMLYRNIIVGDLYAQFLSIKVNLIKSLISKHFNYFEFYQK